MIPALVGIRVLLVEDYQFHQLLAKNLLTSAGVQVSISCNGIEAIAAIKENQFDAILMDIQMPEMDGLEATRIIRKEFSFEELPIIAMTANATPEDQEQYISEGMNECIPKPIHFQSLYDTLIRCTHHKLESKRQQSTALKNLTESKACFYPEISIERVGSKAIFLYMLDNFTPNYAQSVQKILNAVTANNLAEAKRTAHSLKGAAATVGAPLLFESARQLEIAFASQESWKYLPLIEVLRSELFRAVNAIDIYLNTSVA